MYLQGSQGWGPGGSDGTKNSHIPVKNPCVNRPAHLVEVTSVPMDRVDSKHTINSWTGPFPGLGEPKQTLRKEQREEGLLGSWQGRVPGKDLASPHLLSHNISFRDCRAKLYTRLLWVMCVSIPLPFLGSGILNYYLSVYRNLPISPASLYQNGSHKAPGSGPAFGMPYKSSS